MVMSAVVFSVVSIAIVVGSVLVMALVFVAVVMVAGPTAVVAVTVVASWSEFRDPLFKIVNRTNPNIPRPRSVPRKRKSEHEPIVHLPFFIVDTCPSLGGLTG